MINIGVFLSGRGSNFQNIYECIDSGYINKAKISVVFSNNINAAGVFYAESKGIDTVILSVKDFSNMESYDRAIIKALKKYNLNLICLSGYMRIVTKELLNYYKNKIINIHPSLLPSFSGLCGQKQALDYGVKYTGCTVHFVDLGVDTGPIILQSVVPIFDDDTEESLSSRILVEEHKLYPKVVKLFSEGKITLENRRVYIKR